MLIYDNGIYRKATEDDMKQFQTDEIVELPPTIEERLAELEEALVMLLDGVTE